MAIVFPTSLDSLSNPASGALLSTGHAAQHADVNDAVEALEARVGITGSADATSLTKRIAVLEAAGGAAGIWLPGDQNLLAWNYDPTSGSSSNTFTAGTLQVIKIRIPAGTVTNIVLCQSGTNAPASFYAALFVGTAGGALLSQSANVSASFGSAGVKTIPLGTPQVVTAGVYYVGFWGAATIPALAMGQPPIGSANAGLGATVSRFGTANTGLTTTAPSNIGTIAAITNTSAFWVAVS